MEKKQQADSTTKAKQYLLSVGEGIARDGDEGVLLGVEYSGGGVHTESLHVGSLERPSDATSRVVRHLKGRRVTVAEDRWYQKERGGVEDDLGVGSGDDVSGSDGLGHVDDLVVMRRAEGDPFI
ncbi:hypothetical protein PRIPAC_87248, partial [Pristionchus pacificus]|uniref:Uncharacterized protein n=1 Tax=Pristionchus pacificus TaxID=54126 RepID=A0A2A6CYI4_PRIPA